VNKNEFLKIIREGLNDFPKQELDEIIYDYEEHFSNALSDGKTEEEIIRNLGDPFVIVNQYRNGYVQSVPRYKNSNGNGTKNNNTSYNDIPPKKQTDNSNSINTILKIAIVFFAVILLGPFGLAGGAGLFALALTIVVVPFALSLSGIALLLGKFGLNLFGFAVPAFLVDFPTSVIILLTIGSIAATILVTILSVYLLKALINLIKRLFNKFSSKGVN